MKLAHFKLGMAVTYERFTGKVASLEPGSIRVRWDSGIFEVFREEDLQRKNLRPLFPSRTG